MNKINLAIVLSLAITLGTIEINSATGTVLQSHPTSDALKLKGPITPMKLAKAKKEHQQIKHALKNAKDKHMSVRYIRDLQIDDEAVDKAIADQEEKVAGTK